MSDNAYIIGKGKAPTWCADQLMPYLKMDGSIGCEYHGRIQIHELIPGDTLIRHGTRVDVRRKNRRRIINKGSRPADRSKDECENRTEKNNGQRRDPDDATQDKCSTAEGSELEADDLPAVWPRMLG